MARVRKQAPNPGPYTDEWDSRVMCGWSDCDRPGSMLFYLVECFSGLQTTRRDHSELPDRPRCPECRKTLFCCEQHADFARRSHVPGQYGKLPAGVNARYL